MSTYAMEFTVKVTLRIPTEYYPADMSAAGALESERLLLEDAVNEALQYSANVTIDSTVTTEETLV